MYIQIQNMKIWKRVFALFGKETKGLPEDVLLKYIDKTISDTNEKNFKIFKFSKFGCNSRI